MLKSSQILAVMFFATVGTERDLVQAACYSAIGDSSVESEAIFSKALDMSTEIVVPKGARFIHSTRVGALSGIDFKDRQLRKGPIEGIEEWLNGRGARVHAVTREIVARVQERGNKAIVIADDERDLGVIELGELGELGEMGPNSLEIRSV